MKVQFVRDELYENLGRNKGTQYLQNSVHDFEPAFAERWLRRGAAKLVKEDEESSEKTDVPAPVKVKQNQSTGGPIKPPVDAQSTAAKGETQDQPASKDQSVKAEQPLPLKK